MRCPICNRYMKDGTWNNHHLWFPKRKFKGTRKGRITVPVHVGCHKQFHFYFLHYCLQRQTRDCDNCRYIRICCYARDV